MLKNYWNNEIARWNRHPYLYTTITVVVVGWTLYDAYQVAKLDRELHAEMYNS